ncbi:MAG: type II secretion system minor pseudopilin GspJ [Gammaproteobacteria bacterium]|nr:type II secretion system minor pseudopilin GspJ [Gammaproteobacteria bacterium]MDH3750741.1 type II secretion system minor pseudopilin GspJ [Gammaproteobacteria bacterium]MDH3804929.1 type II secretion system minor pseudopilin GspJ [Gammaproteobacteria bacterium]
MTGVRSRGFTLIEVLVALAVFGVMSMLAYAALGSTLSNADYLTDRMDRLQSIQRTVRYLSTDLIQAAPRPVRSELGDGFSPALQTSLSSEFVLELTHGGWGNPAGLPRGTLQRVAYRLEDDELVRYHWRVLDRTFANEPIATVLLDDVESLFFRYYHVNDEVSEIWPLLAQQGPGDLRSRPRAVEIVLTLVDQGEIRRLLEVAP